MLQDIPDSIPKVLICILCGYERHQWISPQLMQFLVDLKYNQDYATFVTKAYNFIPAAGARNFISLQAKGAEPKPDWVLMIDNDMGPADNLLDTIKDVPADADIVVPMFYLWDGEKTKLCWGIGTDGNEITSMVVKKQYYSLSKCGTGAIFIRPRVFETMVAPWFEYKYEGLGNMVGTEDISFCEKALAAGLKIYGWGGSVVSHFHTVDIAVINKLLNEKVTEAENSDKQTTSA